MKYQWIVLLIVMFNLTSCQKEDIAKANSVNIRIENTSIYDYKNIKVLAGGIEQLYGNLDAMHASDYKVFPYAYSYAYVELEIDGSKYVIQPIDYVGETRLDNGFYTYQVSSSAANDQFGRLSIELVED